MTNSDLGRLLKSFEIQSVLRAPMYVKNEFNVLKFLNHILENVKHAVKLRRIH